MSLAFAGRFGMLLLVAGLTFAEFSRFASARYHHQGVSHLDAEQFGRAETLFAHAEELTPWDWRYPRYRGIAHYRAQDYAGAIEHLEASRRLNPYWVTTLIPLSNAALNHATSQKRMPDNQRRQYLADAVDYAQEACALNPKSALATEVLGRALYTHAALLTRAQQSDEALQDEWRAAADALNQAIANGPDKPGPLLAMLGQANSSLNQPDEASRWLAEAVRVEPDQDTHWATFFNFAQKHGKHALMDEQLTEALAQIGDSPHLLLWQARVRDAGQFPPEQVEQAYRAACAANANQTESWIRFGYFATKTGSIDPFKETFIAEADPNAVSTTPELRALTVMWSASPPDYAEAAKILAEQLVETPREHRPRLAKSIRWTADIVLDEVQGSAVKSHREGAALLDLGRLFRAAGQRERASELFAAASGLLQGDRRIESLWWTGQTHVELGDIDQAAAVLTTAQLGAPDDPNLQVLEAQILVSEGATEPARDLLDNALRSTRLSAEARHLAQQTFETLPD